MNRIENKLALSGYYSSNTPEYCYIFSIASCFFNCLLLFQLPPAFSIASCFSWSNDYAFNIGFSRMYYFTNYLILIDLNLAKASIIIQISNPPAKAGVNRLRNKVLVKSTLKKLTTIRKSYMSVCPKDC